MAIQSARADAEPKARVKARSPKIEAPSPRAEEAARAPVREPMNKGYFDREGNPISRRNPGYRNEFEFQKDEVPEGWEYQWIRHTVHGDPSESELWDMQENGWRPVPHKRHAGRFMGHELFKGDQEKGKDMCILRKGQLLVERPKGMCDEARLQQKREADQAIKDRYRQFALPLPDNVRQMGLEAKPGIARQSEDVAQVRSDAMPKHDLAID